MEAEAYEQRKKNVCADAECARWALTKKALKAIFKIYYKQLSFWLESSASATMEF